MGCFSYSCALTGLPICRDDKVLLLPILCRKEKRVYNYTQEGLGKIGVPGFMLDDTERGFFIEGTYPIFGEYNDYGGIVNIVKDDNTRAIEEYFGISVEEFCGYLTDTQRDRWDTYEGSRCYKINEKTDKYEEILALSVTWFRKDVYDELTSGKEKILYNFSGDIDLNNLYKSLELEKINFDIKKEREIKFEGIFSRRKEKQSKIICKFEKSKKGLNWFGNCKGLDFIIESSETKKIEILEKFKQDSFEISLYDLSQEVRLELAKMIGESEEELDIVEYVKYIRQDIDERQEYEFYLRNKLFCGVWMQFNKIQFFEFCRGKVFENLGIEFLKTNMINWLLFRINMYFMGRFLCPIGPSPQTGEHKLIKKIYKTALKVLEKDIKLQYS